MIAALIVTAGLANVALGQGSAAEVAEVGSQAEAILFYAIAAMTAFCALGCVLSANIVRMAMCLFGTLGSVAILYFLMSANFLAAIQLIVYAGGTLIVIIFGVMLTSMSPLAKFAPKRGEIIAGGVVCLCLFAALATILVRGSWSEAAGNPANYEVAQIGTELLTTYLVPFELASVLLLAVMIGAAYLARTEKR